MCKFCDNPELAAATQNRDMYLEYMEHVPAATYNNNQEIYQAELERLNKQIDDLLDEAEQERICKETISDASPFVDALMIVVAIGAVRVEKYGHDPRTPEEREQDEAWSDAQIKDGVSSPEWWDAQKERSDGIL